MKLNQFAIYQLKMTPELRNFHFRSWEDVEKSHLPIREENYEQAYIGRFQKDETVEEAWKRMREMPPKQFKGHSISTSDVIVANKDGIVSSYYIGKDRLHPFSGFFRLGGSGSLITMDTRDYQKEGVKGNWIAADEIIVDGRQFFLMEHETFRDHTAFLIVDDKGNLVTDDCYSGFDDSSIQKIREFIHPPVQQVALQQKVELENWQKAFENGEYLRSSEMADEQNYNMIDGLKNNAPSKKKEQKFPPDKRPSVLAKLWQKQKALAEKHGKAKVQENEMERGRK